MAFSAECRHVPPIQGDDLTDRFFRVLAELAVRHCLANEATAPGSGRPGALSFVATDALVRLLVTLIVGAPTPP